MARFGAQVHAVGRPNSSLQWLNPRTDATGEQSLVNHTTDR